MPTLREIVDQRVREGDLYEKLDRNRVRCYACGHCCPIPEGQPGVCKVRFNRGGTLYVPWGYVGGIQCDPIEKKPFFHAYPGALAYSFGMLGCDLHCSYCQNWVTSQALRDPDAVSSPLEAAPEDLVRDAVRQGARVLVSTYNEPLITAEWAVAILKEARAAGLVTGFVSNGNGTPQVLEYLRPWLDLYKVDLKSFNDRHYRELGGRLQPILDTIRSLHAMGLWVEIVTLLIPGFNDSDDELTRLENTYCHHCGMTLIRRFSYQIEDYLITSEGNCPGCGGSIPGRWASRFEGQIAARPFLPHRASRLVTIANRR
jgi:pyruvate formate lyase activating enzyme